MTLNWIGREAFLVLLVCFFPWSSAPAQDVHGQLQNSLVYIDANGFTELG
jgi:hypothetical protein